MSGRIDRTDIDQAFDRLVRLAEKVNGSDAPSSWELLEGDAEATPRQPWVVVDGQGRRVLSLGYTRRAALSALLSMDSILAVVLGA